MTMKGADLVTDNYFNTVKLFHDYGLLAPNRTVYFGSEFYDENGGETGIDHASLTTLMKNLITLESYDPGLPITVVMSSPGGSWYHGMAAYDTIKTLISPVTMIATGFCFSMGTVLLQAAKKRIISKRLRWMMHDGYDGFAGVSKAFEAWGEESKFTRQRMYEIYYERMKKKNKKITLDDIESLCSHDRIFGAEWVIENNLADAVLAEVRQPKRKKK